MLPEKEGENLHRGDDKVLEQYGLPVSGTLGNDGISPPNMITPELAELTGDPALMSDIEKIADALAPVGPGDQPIDPEQLGDGGVPPVVGEGTPDEIAQTDIDLTMADARGLDTESAGAEDVIISPLVEDYDEVPSIGVDAILAAAVDHIDNGFLEEAYDAGLAPNFAFGEELKEYTEAEFRKRMKGDKETAMLLEVFDGLKGRSVVFNGEIEGSEYLTDQSALGDIELYESHLIFKSTIPEGCYVLRQDGELSISLNGYFKNGSPHRDLQSMSRSIGLLQRVFLAYHDLLDQTPNFPGEETRFLDGSTSLVGDEPLEMAYSTLSQQPKNKLPGHEVVVLNNKELRIDVYNPGDKDPVFSGWIDNSGEVRVDMSYSGYLPIAFETISRGLETLERAYKAFIGLDISPKAEQN